MTLFVLGMLAGFFMAVVYATIADTRGKPPAKDTPPWFEDWNSEEDSVYDA